MTTHHHLNQRWLIAIMPNGNSLGPKNSFANVGPSSHCMPGIEKDMKIIQRHIHRQKRSCPLFGSIVVPPKLMSGGRG